MHDHGFHVESLPGMKTKLIAASLFFSTLSHAGDFKIKEYEIGLPIESYKFAYLCKPNAIGQITCYDPAPSLTIGGETVKKALIKFDSNEKISMIYFSFGPESFDAIKAAVSSKYKTGRCTKSVVENGFGAKFSNENCLWKTKNEHLSLQKYTETITQGSLTLVSNDRLDLSIEQSKEKSKDI